MNAIAKSQRFELLSSHSNLNYPNLVHYISAAEKFTSRKLAYRITKIIRNSISQFKKEVIRHYYSHLSAKQQKCVLLWISEGLEKEFVFEDYTFLVSNGYSTNKKTMAALKKHLKDQIALSHQDPSVITQPEHDYCEDLNLIGYYCRVGFLKRKNFSEFVNVSPMFDLFYQFEKFDFERFDVTWIVFVN